MNKLRCLMTSSIVAVSFAIAGPSWASGSYCACLPKPPAKTARAKVDRDKYDLGQKVFNGKTAPAQGDATAQRAKLETLQGDLPEKVARKKNLASMAGKLTPDQLDALGYFIEERYPKSK